MTIYALPNKWFLSIDPENPAGFEIFTTEDGISTGKKKLYRVRMHDGPPYVSPMIEELSAKTDGTVGEIHPIVCKTIFGLGPTYVAVKPNQRHVEKEKVVEAWRKSWDNPAERPVVRLGWFNFLTEKELGFGYANTARILGLIAYRMTVITTLFAPRLSDGEWMNIKEFALKSKDQMGKAVIGSAKMLGYL